MVAIIDYGVGNLFSLQSSFSRIGTEAVVTGSAQVIEKADRLLLPGVGAFGDAAQKLRESGLSELIKSQVSNGKPLLGVCLGMQLLFQRSYEYGEHEGLGLLEGSVVPIAPMTGPKLKVPQIGWNALHFVRESPLFRYVPEGAYVYFVHSYAAVGCEDSLLATTDYGASLTAAVGKGGVYGCQFHPEKSGGVGLSILRAFCEL